MACCCHTGYILALIGSIAFLFSLHVLHSSILEFILFQFLGIFFFIWGILCMAHEHFIGKRRIVRTESVELARIDRINEIVSGLPLDLKDDSKSEKLPTYDEATKDLPSYKEAVKV
ncbi:hypothetical protein PVAND_005371 [Polypedilum vanderplanki]|uniref:Uncharacterized protein n=1 Tax=Polypedilum vanderplanki TaxID=319348 RepID=A0A9J6C1V5_POLVA|nr:hypothetical protein PVAND_005371 [Polypedilum vanderplanki]